MAVSSPSSLSPLRGSLDSMTVPLPPLSSGFSRLSLPDTPPRAQRPSHGEGTQQQTPPLLAPLPLRPVPRLPQGKGYAQSQTDHILAGCETPPLTTLLLKRKNQSCLLKRRFASCYLQHMPLEVTWDFIFLSCFSVPFEHRVISIFPLIQTQQVVFITSYSSAAHSSSTCGLNGNVEVVLSVRARSSSTDEHSPGGSTAGHKGLVSASLAPPLCPRDRLPLSGYLSLPPHVAISPTCLPLHLFLFSKTLF